MASQSVLELAVNTGKWDSGLKKAKTALDNFTTASGGLQQALGKDADKMGTFVRMMGSMESRAKSAKGQMSDYKSTIEQLTMQYNRMTVAQQKTIGQDYLRTIEQLRQKYQAVNQEVQQMNRNLQQTPDVGNGGGLLSGLGGKLGGAMQVFAGNVMTKVAGSVVGFGAEMADMVQQGIELAKQGEGIRIAFERLGRGDILDGLRQATHGTVTDLELMKAAVKFNDFKLPVEELGTMLAFAQQKAKDTGQSVDYMVDSIVTGLGRKSLMILDNLGLSAAEIKSKMAETGDMTKAVGAIIREQMSKAGDYVETAADRATQATVSLENKMEELGRKFLPVQEASDNLWTSMKIGILDIIGGPLAKLLNKLTEAGRIKNLLGSYEEGDNNLLNRLRNSNNKWGEYASTYNDMLRKAKAEEEMARKIADDIAYLNQIGGSAASGVGALATSQKGHEQRARELRAAAKEYAAGAKEILVTINKTDNAVEDVVSPSKTPKKSKTTTPKATEVVPAGSVAALNNELQKLQKEQQKSVSAEGWKSYEESIAAVRNQIKELKGELSNIEAGNMASLAKIEGVSLIDMAAGRVKGKGMKDLGLGEVPTRESIIAKGQKQIRNSKGVESKEKTEVKLTDIMGQVSSGISSMVSGIEGLGIEIPKDMQNMLGALNSITMILTSIEAFQKVGTLLGIFAHGGVVKAAGGYRVPGRTFSGDMVPARLNAGELVLNQAQAGIIASALQDRDFSGDMGGQPYTNGENIILGINNTYKRKGMGEVVTTSMLRRMGLMN